MLTTKILNIFLALQVLTAFHIHALPITSKPIEGTAEHLAWQAWLMLPPEQKSLEKSRKVTPKSIFTLPFRDCPPGHQLFENRCIPTVNIDQKELLAQELLGFFVGDGGADQTYDFDYDAIPEEEEVEGLESMYEPAQKFSGDSNYNYDQLPSQDEPLKFNIFQQKFPTDYEAESNAPSIEQSIEQKSSTNATLIVVADAVKINTTTPQHAAINDLIKPSLNSTQASKNDSRLVADDLQMEGSNVSTNIAPATTTTTTAAIINSAIFNIGHDIVTPTMKTTKKTMTTTTTQDFSFSNIDAIALPATMSSQHSNIDDLASKGQNVQKFSLFKDDSSVQLVTSTLSHDGNEQQQQQNAHQTMDFTHLLKADDLLPLFNMAKGEHTGAGMTISTPTTQTTSTATKATTSRSTEITPPIAADNSKDEVSTLSASSTTGTGIPPLFIDDNETTEMTLIDAEATMPSLFNGKINKETVKDYEEIFKKAEHERSVFNADKLETEVQEENFEFTTISTTIEPDMTTNSQLDETTIDEEMHDAPTIALRELIELAHQQRRENLSVVKKSKVVPVAVVTPPIIETETYSTIKAKVSTATTTSSTTLPTVIAATSISNKPLSVITEAKTKAQETTASTTTVVVEATTVAADRFDDQPELLSISGEIPQETISGDSQISSSSESSNQNDEEHLGDSSHFRNTETAAITTRTTATTTRGMASEIDIEQELRMINELVKGNKRQQLKGGIIKKSTTTVGTTPTQTQIQTTAPSTSTPKPTTTSTESGLTSKVKKSSSSSSSSSPSSTTPISASSNKDKISEVSANEEEESRIGIIETKTTLLPSTTTSTSTSSKLTETEKGTTVEPASTLWSKIMPLLGFSTSVEDIPSTTPKASTSTSTTTKSNPVDNNNNNDSISNNRSNRNSKIIRINSLSEPSLSSNSQNSSGEKQPKLLSTDKTIEKTVETTTTSTSTTTTRTTPTISELSESSGSSGSDSDSNLPPIEQHSEPFWWLPSGWRLDRSPNDSDREPSLLLRFWSAFPGNSQSTEERK